MLDFHPSGFSDDSTPDGVSASPQWSDSLIAAGGEKIRAGVLITDSDYPSPDDVYDGTSFGSGFLDPHFEFDSAYPGTFRLIGDFNAVADKIIGTADASALDPDGSCVLGCLGFKTQGKGEAMGPDEDVRVTQILREEDSLLPWPVLLEVHYISRQEQGQGEADRRYALMKQLPCEILWQIDEPTLLTASRFKAAHRLSLADSLIAAFAHQRETVLLHKDPEFEALDDQVDLEGLPYKASNL